MSDNQPIKRVPKNHEVDLASADTEYSFTIPQGTKMILFRQRAGDQDVRYSFESGEVASGTSGDFSTLFAGESRQIDGIHFVDTKNSEREIYFAHSAGVSVTIEIETWQ